MSRRTSVTEKVALEIWEYVKAFQGYGFNKGHATSYGILAVKMAHLKRWHPAEYFASLLDVFPERPTYLAAARAEGYTFLPPDVNRSQRGFSIDKLGGNAIRVGLGKVRNVGPTGGKAIMDAQPFTDWDDFRSRVPKRQVNSKAITSLHDIGALECLGVVVDFDSGVDQDAAQFHILGFTLEKPQVFKGIKPKHVGERISESGWRHMGRERGVELTGGRSSVSKMFWIPPETKLELKASPWAQVKTWLLTAVDENGLPFHLMVNEDKPHEVRLLKFLHEKCQGAVICIDGMIRLPFVNNGPSGFRMFGITGAFNSDPQMWRLPDGREKKFKLAVSELDKMKRMARYS
jgi:hypothetical protein